MALACSIFTLDGGVQLFSAAFDMPMTVVPLKFALGFEKFDFWEFQKNNWKNSLGLHLGVCHIRNDLVKQLCKDKI